jgi:hypothetical protein
MRFMQSAAIRRARTAIVTTLAAGAGAASLLGMTGTAHAGTYGWVTTTSCTGVAGSVHYSPGLLTYTRRSVHATLTGTTSGCSDIFSGAWSGTGTITAILSGKASVKSENFSGTFTVNWPASSGFNPSNGTLTVTESNGIEVISGTITSGFDTGSVMQLQYVVTGKTGRGTVAHPVTAQTYTNTQPLTLSRNEG